MNDRLQKLKDLMQIANDGLSKDDFLKAFREVLDFLKKMGVKNEEEMQRIENHLNEMADKMQNTSETEMAGMKKEMMSYCESEMKKMYSEHEEMMKKMDEKMANVHDGKDADEEEIITRVITRMPKPIEPDSAYAIRNKLEKLEGKERLKISTIDELQEKLDELKEEMKKEKPRIFGGAPRLRIIKETPSGTIDGANPTFTLSKTPMTGLDLYLNGILQREGASFEYTISAKTITYNTAPPLGSQHYAKIFI